MKKVLVTGGLGFIGSHTVVELQNEGFEVVIIDNLLNSSIEVLDNITSITGVKPTYENIDLKNQDAVEDFFIKHRNIEGVIHFAASKAVGESVEKPLEYYHNNISSLIYLLEEMAANDVTNFIFSSSCTVYGQADKMPITESAPFKTAESPYGNTKQIGEEIIADTAKISDLNGIALRYFNPIGAHESTKIGELPIGVPQNLIPFVTQTAAGMREELSVFGGDYPTPDGTAVRDYIHVVDLAKAHTIALKRLLEEKNKSSFEVFNIGTGKGSSVLEVVKAFEKISNQNLNYKIVDRREGDIIEAYADTSLANKELGWKPELTLEDALAGAWKWQQTLKKIKMKKILITGGAGFIGSHVVRLFVTKYPDYQIFNLDALTYAGNLENIKDIADAPNYTFVKGNIKDSTFLNDLFNKEQFDAVIHLAAESHVDRSIKDPNAFIETNVIGTANLMNAFRTSCNDNFDGKLFYHVSTDEVYGSLGKTGLFTETTSYDPQSPYAASKAASDHMVRSYGNTYNMPFVLSNCSNNYGANHFPEKLIPLFINNIQNNKSLPVYGDGQYTRDWLFVEDHARAIDLIFHKGKIDETYNIGGFNEWTNLDLIHLLCNQMDEKLGRTAGTSAKLITYVKDRAGHDRRYAIDASKLNKELGWKPSVTFEEGLSKTIDWYLANEGWLNNVTSGAYTAYYEKMYS